MTIVASPSKAHTVGIVAVVVVVMGVLAAAVVLYIHAIV